MGSALVFFMLSDGGCVVDGNSYPGIPIFFDADGVIEPLSDYMIHVVTEQRHPATTARTYAAYLQKFVKHLAAIGVVWTDVTDGTLRAWRDALLDRQCLAPGTVGAYLGVVFSFYRWARGERPRSEHGEPVCGPRRRGTSVATRFRRAGPRRGEVYWPHLPRDPGGAVRHTPSHEEVERDPRPGLRDADWGA